MTDNQEPTKGNKGKAIPPKPRKPRAKKERVLPAPIPTETQQGKTPLMLDDREMVAQTTAPWFPTETTKEGEDVAGNDSNTSTATTQSSQQDGKKIVGDVPHSVAVDSLDGYDGPIAREESRAKATNRWILEGRRWDVDRRRKDLIRQGVATGLTREAAADRAWEACLVEFPPPGTEPEAIEPIAEPFANIREYAEDPIEAVPTPISSDQGVPGLGTIPPDWPKLPANAQLQVEISWVSANRLLVRDGSGVDLSRALSPAPSYSALSWLETSILFPSKFADISVKATAQQDDEREGIRREKLAIDEIRGLLAEMLE